MRRSEDRRRSSSQGEWRVEVAGAADGPRTIRVDVKSRRLLAHPHVGLGELLDAATSAQGDAAAAPTLSLAAPPAAPAIAMATGPRGTFRVGAAFYTVRMTSQVIVLDGSECNGLCDEHSREILLAPDLA